MPRTPWEWALAHVLGVERMLLLLGAMYGLAGVQKWVGFQDIQGAQYWASHPIAVLQVPDFPDVPFSYGVGATLLAGAPVATVLAGLWLRRVRTTDARRCEVPLLAGACAGAYALMVGAVVGLGVTGSFRANSVPSVVTETTDPGTLVAIGGGIAIACTLFTLARYRAVLREGPPSSPAPA